MIKVKTYAKINLTLEVLNKRSNDGFHNIQSIMQNINLFDILTFKISKSKLNNEIILSGNVSSIPYDNSNLVYKAIDLFLKKACIQNNKFEVYIEKNIPVEAGLAGGSSNAAATLAVLNNYFCNILNQNELDELCCILGSDLNFCLKGGTCLCTSRGEVVQKLNDIKELHVSLIKPRYIGIKAFYAYKKYSEQKIKIKNDNTIKLAKIIQSNQFDKNFLYNDLETQLVNEFDEFMYIKKIKPSAIMTGSGSVFYIVNDTFDYYDFNPDKYLIFNNIKTINKGYEVL